MANKKFETLDGFLSSGDVEITGNVAVDTDTLFVDSVNNRVGIGKTNPTTLLDVDGNITATNVNATFYGDGSNLTGLIADSIDGANVTSLLRSDVSDEFTGTTFTFNGANVIIKETSSQLVLFQDVPLRFGNTSTPGVSFNLSRTGPSTATFDINTLGTITFSIENDLSVNGAITADSFTGTVDATTVGGNTAATLLSRTNHTGTQLLSTISDAGTIASQNSDSVTITGGSINGVPIGASTANTAEFTQITLDGPMRENSAGTSGTTPTLSATNGPIITWTPSGTATGTVSLTGGESLLVLLTTGGNTVSWSGVDKWVGGSAPTLDGTETNAIEFWKVGATTYGAFVGVVS